MFYLWFKYNYTTFFNNYSNSLQCDIEEILRRAETTEEAPASVTQELLSAFKVVRFVEESTNTEEGRSKSNNNKDWVSYKLPIFNYIHFYLII